MNSLFLSAICLLLFVNGGCQNRQNGQNSSGQTSSFYATPQEAVQQAQRDLAAVLRANPSLQLGLDSSTVGRTQPGKAIQQFSLDFNRLLQPGTPTEIRSLVQVERSSLVPLLVDNQARTAVELTHQPKGWRVASLGNQAVANDLNALGALAVGTTITRYEVPNLNIFIYGVRRGTGAEEYYTNYKQFTLRQAIPLERLYDLLRQDAQTFQRQYGSQLKRQRKVH